MPVGALRRRERPRRREPAAYDEGRRRLVVSNKARPATRHTVARTSIRAVSDPVFGKPRSTRPVVTIGAMVGVTGTVVIVTVVGVTGTVVIVTVVGVTVVVVVDGVTVVGVTVVVVVTTTSTVVVTVVVPSDVV